LIGQKPSMSKVDRGGNVTDVVTDTVTDERELYTHARAAQS